MLLLVKNDVDKEEVKSVKKNGFNNQEKQVPLKSN
jgi:hypothetical protein